MNNSYNDKEGKYPFRSVTLETIDGAVYEYFNTKLNVSIEAERGRTKVPVVFASGERWKLIRDNKGLRDEHGTLILPIIAIRRLNVDRTPGFGGLGQEVKELTIKVNKHSKTGNLQNMIKQRKVNGFPEMQEGKVIDEYITIPYPDFSTIYYEISIWTQYQTQMNDILEKIFYSYNIRDSFVMHSEYDGNKPKGNSYYFVGFREGDVAPQSNVEEFTDQERIIKTSYNIKVPAYLILDPKDETLSYGKDDEGKKVVYKYQNAPEIKLKEEIISLEDYEKKFG